MIVTTVPALQVLSPLSASGGDPSVGSEGVVVLAVEGDIDLYTGPDLRLALTDLLASTFVSPGGATGSTDRGGTADGQAGPASMWAVVIDMSDVEFVDSYAVGVLVQGHHLARRRGCAYALVATHPMIHRLFVITGLARVMPLHPDVASAVARLRPAGLSAPQ